MIVKVISALFLYLLALSAEADVHSYFDQIKTDPLALYTFFKAMPKGGELHYHLAGGPYAETLVKIAAKADYCIENDTFKIIKASSHTCNGIKITNLLNHPAIYNELIKSWSMKDFIPGKEAGDQHFFNTFIKFLPIVFDYRAALLTDIIKKASQQHELYLELLDIPDNAHSASFGPLLKNAKSYPEMRNILLNNPEYQKNIHQTVAATEHLLHQTRKNLNCARKPNSPACQVTIKILNFTLREQPLDRFFAQTLNAFESTIHSKGMIVGVNIVQQENGIISLRDYRQHMAIFNYLHKIYPTVPISLHAGELTLDKAIPSELSYHVHDAIFTGQAQRIGHGSDIAYEANALKTLNYMAAHHIAVEISLISNLKILNISGKNHPLNYYLSHDVPVVLSTDDEGILRTDLTQQYVTAVLDQGLNYAMLKQINRNTLTYAFIPGQSIWQAANKAQLVPACEDLTSKSCSEYLTNSKKAQLQWQLEQELIKFERNFNK